MKVKKPNPFTSRYVIPFFLLIIWFNSSVNAQSIAIGLTTRRTLASDFYGYDMSTTTRGGVSCVSPELKSHLPLLKPKFLRYPSGSSANWWDWHKGWYVDSPFLPSWDQNKPSVPNRLEDFKGLLSVTGAKALFDLNVLTSNVRDQIAMLKHADSIGISVNYIELGNEFYLEGDGADDTALILIRYPTPRSYADTANIWIDSIHKYFPSAKIGLQGCFQKKNDTRNTTWNDSVLTRVQGENAVTFHYYYASRFADSTETDADKLNVNMSDVPDWFYQPYKAWGLLRDGSLSKVPDGQEIWITEYNFSDHVRPVHGTWASGLYTALHAMQLMQDDRISHIVLHGVDGQAVFGAFYYGTDGFKYGMDELSNYVGPVNPPDTEPWGLNGYGHTMTVMGDAVDTKKYASKISFTPNPQLSCVEKGVTINYDGLFGFQFSDESKSQAVIVNLTGVDQSIKTNVMFPAGGSYEMRNAGVLDLIAKASDVTITNKSTLPATLVLKPYSITRISANTVLPPPPAVNISHASSTVICEGDSVQLDAGPGFISYVWSTGQTTQKIWVKSTGDYWIHAYKVPSGYYGEATIHVTVNAVPKSPNIVLSGNKTFCAGGSVGIQLGSSYDPTGLTFYWPLTGSTSSSIVASSSGNYYMQVMNEFGCKALSDTETVTVNPLPAPVVTAVGPSSACYNVKVTLQATTGYASYQWSSGGWGQTQVFSASGTYSVDAKDQNGCHGFSNSKSVTVWDLDVPQVTSVGSTSYCGGAVSSYLTTLPGYNYHWLKGNVQQAGATNQHYTPGEGGTYKVQITDSHGCSRTSASGVKVSVYKTPASSITINGGLNICNGQTRTLTASATGGGGFTYKWKKNSSYIAGATNKTYVVNSPASYTCEITNSDNCTGTSNIIKTTANCKDGDETAAPDNKITLQVYPNPASENIHLQLNSLKQESGNCSIQLRNILGDVVFENQDNFSGYTLSSNIHPDASIPDGVYFIVVKIGTDLYFTRVVIGK